MTTAQRLREDISAANKIVALIAERFPNEFAVRRCEVDVRRLIEQRAADVDLSMCFASLAMLHMIKREPDQALEAARNAAHLHPEDRATVTNLLNTLMNLGDLQGAGELIGRWEGRAQGNFSLLATIISCEVGRFREETALPLWREACAMLQHDDPRRSEFSEESMVRAIKRRTAAGYSAEDMEARLVAAIDVVREGEGLGPLRTSHQSLHDGSSIHTLFVDAPLERCVELDWQIVDHLIENFDRTGDEVLTVRCYPLDAYFDLNAGPEAPQA